MSGKRRIVKDIVTNGCNKAEYNKIYRGKSPEERMKKALDLGKLDTDYYKSLIKTLKGDPRTRKMIALFWFIGVTGGIVNFTVNIAVTSIIKHMFL